jgi:hypothetical protein
MSITTAEKRLLQKILIFNKKHGGQAAAKVQLWRPYFFVGPL